MNSPVVVDASVGVKWFKREDGSEQAWALLERHGVGEVVVYAPEHCLGEVLAVVARRTDPSEVLRAWDTLERVAVERIPLAGPLVREALRQHTLLGCDFYDALAPALAALLEAPLYSADRRAHGAFPGVHILGE